MDTGEAASGGLQSQTGLICGVKLMEQHRGDWVTLQGTGLSRLKGTWGWAQVPENHHSESSSS